MVLLELMFKQQYRYYYKYMSEVGIYKRQQITKSFHCILKSTNGKSFIFLFSGTLQYEYFLHFVFSFLHLMNFCLTFFNKTSWIKLFCLSVQLRAYFIPFLACYLMMITNIKSPTSPVYQFECRSAQPLVGHWVVRSPPLCCIKFHCITLASVS